MAVETTEESIYRALAPLLKRATEPLLQMSLFPRVYILPFSK